MESFCGRFLGGNLARIWDLWRSWIWDLLRFRRGTDLHPRVILTTADPHHDGQEQQQTLAMTVRGKR